MGEKDDVTDSDFVKEFQLLESWRENVLKKFENIENDQSWLFPHREINWYSPLQNNQKAVVENKDRNKVSDNIPVRIVNSSCSSGKTDVPDPEEHENVFGIGHQTVTNLKHQNKENLGKILNFPGFQMLQCVTPPSIFDSSIICREFVEERLKLRPVSSSTPLRSLTKKAFDFPKHIPPVAQLNATFDLIELSKHDSRLSVDNSVHAEVTYGSDNPGSKENSNSADHGPINETVTIKDTSASLKDEGAVSQDSADDMAPQKKLTPQEIKAKKKEDAKRRREKIKRDPVLLAIEREKEKKKYEAKKMKKQVKLVNDMSRREQKAARTAWRERSKKSYEKRKNAARFGQYLASTSPPISEADIPQQGKTAADNFEKNGEENSCENSCIPNIAHPKPSLSSSSNIHPRTIQIPSRIPRLQFRSKLD